jgi:hypothetical protein
MVVLNKLKVETNALQDRFAVNFREETSRIPMLPWGYNFDRRYLSLFYPHHARRWRKEARTPFTLVLLARSLRSPPPQNSGICDSPQ